MRKTVQSFILLVIILPFAAKSQNDQSTQAILVNAKLVGLCGAISQMVSFQQVTKMNGGDEFVERFASTEYTRLGYKNLTDFINQCKTSIELHEKMMEVLNTSSTKENN